MVISVVPQTAAMTITKRPYFHLPALACSHTKMEFTCDRLEAECQCQITGLPTDNPAGWTLGLIQLQWTMTDWAYYRGQTNVDGDSFLQLARPPARPAQECRDTIDVGAIFVDNWPGHDRTVAKAGQPFPITMKALLGDRLRLFHPLTRVNALTGSTNFLREVQIECHFCSVLSLRDPEPRRGSMVGTFTHLKHLLWNVHWHTQFQPTDFADVTKRWTVTRMGGSAGNTSNVSRNIFDGGPTDPKLTRIITAGAAPNCNVLARNAANTPNLRESRVWTTYDVRC